MRDPVATYHKMSLAEFGKMTPHMNWPLYVQQQGAKNVTDGTTARRSSSPRRLADRRDAGGYAENLLAGIP